MSARPFQSKIWPLFGRCRRVRRNNNCRNYLYDFPSHIWTLKSEVAFTEILLNLKNTRWHPSFLFLVILFSFTFFSASFPLPNDSNNSKADRIVGMFWPVGKSKWGPAALLHDRGAAAGRWFCPSTSAKSTGWCWPLPPELWRIWNAWACPVRSRILYEPNSLYSLETQMLQTKKMILLQQTITSR